MKQLSRSIISGNPEYIISAPEWVPKLAKRIILELAQTALLIGNNQELDLSYKSLDTSEVLEENNVSSYEGESQKGSEGSNVEQEAILALIKLGYERMAATRVVVKICSENEKLEISDLIRLSLPTNFW